MGDGWPELGDPVLSDCDIDALAFVFAWALAALSARGGARPRATARSTEPNGRRAAPDAPPSAGGTSGRSSPPQSAPAGSPSRGDTSYRRACVRSEEERNDPSSVRPLRSGRRSRARRCPARGPSAAPGPHRGPLDGPKNLRVAAITPHSVTLAWDAALNSGSFTYVIEASFGYRAGVPQTQTSYTWTRDMVPGRTYSFVMWTGDARGRQSAKSNPVTVTLPVDTRPPDAPVVSVTGTSSSTVGLAWGPVADDDHTCCSYRVFANGALVSADRLLWTGERAVTVLRLAAAISCSFTIVAVDPSKNASAPSAAVTATTLASTDTTGPSAPGNLTAWDFGCETWLFWEESVDDVDPQYAISYEVRVNSVFDGVQTGIDRWITYGTHTSNTFTVQAIDSAGNRSATSTVTLENQTC